MKCKKIGFKLIEKRHSETKYDLCLKLIVYLFENGVDVLCGATLYDDLEAMD